MNRRRWWERPTRDDDSWVPFVFVVCVVYAVIVEVVKWIWT